MKRTKVKISLPMFLIVILGIIMLFNYEFKSTILYSLMHNDALAENDALNIELSVDNSGFGSMKIDWSSYDITNKNFKVYKSADGGETYETVGMDYTMVKSVKVLQIYPEKGAGQLQSWVVDSGYGKGIISVDEVSMSDFNQTPEKYLYKTDSNWNYDVIFWGASDSNNFYDFSEISKDVTEQFIKDGKGIILGHDTALNVLVRSPNIRETKDGTTKTGQVNADELAEKYFKALKNGTTPGVRLWQGSTEVQIAKKGLFTNYPNYIGEVGTILTIPYSHTVGQVVVDGYEDNVWLKFYGEDTNESSNPAKGTDAYLVTYNNLAMIQTGHSGGKATEDEQKIIANLIFYMNQLITGNYLSDPSAQDVAGPNAPTVNLKGDSLIFSANDNGSEYQYYVESYSKDDTSSTGLIDKSDIVKGEVKTGVAQYAYILDDQEDTEVTTSNAAIINGSAIKLNSAYKYVHVAAVDGAGNIGDTTTLKISEDIPTDDDDDDDDGGEDKKDDTEKSNTVDEGNVTDKNITNTTNITNTANTTVTENSTNSTNVTNTTNMTNIINTINTTNTTNVTSNTNTVNNINNVNINSITNTNLTNKTVTNNLSLNLSNTASSNNTISTKNSTEDDTIAKKILPQTGSATNKVLVVTLMLSFFGIAAYLAYKKYQFK